MRTGRAVCAIATGMLVLSANARAAALDTTLDKAKAEGRIIMLELGSAGRNPCEQMKAVMARLTETYEGKLDVVFVDVKKDHATAQ